MNTLHNFKTMWAHTQSICIIILFSFSYCVVSAVEGQEQGLVKKVELVKGTTYLQLKGSFPLRSPFSLFADQAVTLAEAYELIGETFAHATQRVVIDCSNSCRPGMAAAEALAARIRAEKK